MQQPSCVCEQALQHSFTSVRESVLNGESTTLLEGCDLVTRDKWKWKGLYRCRTCGRLWVEDGYMSGHATVFYLYPAPETDDIQRWLDEEAKELPW